MKACHSVHIVKSDYIICSMPRLTNWCINKLYMITMLGRPTRPCTPRNLSLSRRLELLWENQSQWPQFRRSIHLLIVGSSLAHLRTRKLSSRFIHGEFILFYYARTVRRIQFFSFHAYWWIINWTLSENECALIHAFRFFRNKYTIKS